ncbi:GTP-binding protein (plasmid) [Tistrella bauzanensis]|uniref:GTP-binding protein n=1 Tax=Tistrella arctica TaxID=3133430 RepID=A0ABU9YRP7_9PROT
MTVPVLVVTGYLGAGKTTLINAMLAQAGGRRIAAVVNDFGAINIDEELIRARADGAADRADGFVGRADDIVGLANGCVCCTLQGDLLRTLKLLLARDPAPDHIVIEASGVADPAGIVQALADPVLWKSARLDAVLCVVDAEDVIGDPARRGDDLWRAQLAAANFVVLSKTAAIDDAAVEALSGLLSPAGKPPVIDMAREALPTGLFLDTGARPTRFTAVAAGEPHRSDRFATVEWQSPGAISLTALQALIAEYALILIRAKGIFHFHEKPGRRYLLQMVGRRVTLEPLPGDDQPGCRLVMIAEAGRLDRQALLARLGAETATPCANH